MSHVIYARNGGWDVELCFEEAIGCCGIATLYGLEVNSYGSEKDKPGLLKDLKDKILNRCEDFSYGIIQLTALGKIHDWSMSYWSSTRTRHDGKLDLAELAKYLRMKKGHSTLNPNTGNEIIMYSKVVGTYDEDKF